jgi:RNA polymerase sigma factor (sigma-70 family)
MAITVKKELPKLFCTVLREFKPDGVTPIWEVNKTLQNRLENLLEKQPSLLTEDECTVHWIGLYRDRERSNPQLKLVESFLCYYLQQIAYQVANKTYNSAVVSMSRTETGTYKKDELFAIANAKIPKVIQNFNPNAIAEFTASSGSRLGAYAYQVFRNAVRAEISIQQIDRLSDWGLLVYGVTPSYLVKALQEQGMADDEIKYHRLILHAFQQTHRVAGVQQPSPTMPKREPIVSGGIDADRQIPPPSNRPVAVETEWKRSSRLPAPNEEQIQSIITCYNQLRQDRPQYQDLPPLTASCGNMVIQSLSYCAQAVRTAKQEPQLVSLNKLLRQEDTELGDLIPDLQTHSPIVAVTQDEFVTVLRRQVEELSPQWQVAMKLIYGKGFKQAAVASQCQVDQCTVSRWQHGNRGKGGWLRTLQEKLAAHYEPTLVLTTELLNQTTGIEALEYYLELLYSCD